jgi:hypothetical protein
MTICHPAVIEQLTSRPLRPGISFIRSSLRLDPYQSEFDHSLPDQTFGAIGLHAARLKRQYSTSLKELLHLKDRCNKEFEEEMEKAALIHHADLVFKRPSSVADFGFDFTIPKIELYISERQAIKIARHELSIRGLNWAASELSI